MYEGEFDLVLKIRQSKHWGFQGQSVVNIVFLSLKLLDFLIENSRKYAIGVLDKENNFLTAHSSNALILIVCTLYIVQCRTAV